MKYSLNAMFGNWEKLKYTMPSLCGKKYNKVKIA